jgi:hypothetical protein
MRPIRDWDRIEKALFLLQMAMEWLLAEDTERVELAIEAAYAAGKDRRRPAQPAEDDEGSWAPRPRTPRPRTPRQVGQREAL